MILAIALTLLLIFDGWSTYRILKNGGRERNPVMRWLFENFGMYESLLGTRLGAIVLVWLLALNAGAWGYLVLIALTIFYVWVAVNNYKAM